MGLNLYPGGTGSNQTDYGQYPLDIGSWGPAPAANAAPTVSTGAALPATPGIVVPDSVTTALNFAQANPTLPQQNGLFGGMKNWNMDTTKTVLGGIGMLGQIWSAFQANKIARDSLDFQKKTYKENLTNQRSSYNMALEDRANARYAQMGRPDDAAAYIEKHRLGG